METNRWGAAEVTCSGTSGLSCFRVVGFSRPVGVLLQNVIIIIRSACLSRSHRQKETDHSFENLPTSSGTLNLN